MEAALSPAAAPESAPDAERVPLRPYPYRMLRAMAWALLFFYAGKSVVWVLRYVRSDAAACVYLGVPAFALMGACLFYLLRAAARIDAQAVRLCSGFTFARAELEPPRWQVLLAMAPFCVLSALQAMTVVTMLDTGALGAPDSGMESVYLLMNILGGGIYLAVGLAIEELLLYLRRLAVAARYFTSGDPVRFRYLLCWPLGVLLFLWSSIHFLSIATNSSELVSTQRLYLFTISGTLLAGSVAVFILAHGFDRVASAWRGAASRRPRLAWPGGGGHPWMLAVLGAAMFVAVIGTFMDYSNAPRMLVLPYFTAKAMCILPWVAVRIEFRKLRSAWEALAQGGAARAWPRPTLTVWAARLVPVFVLGMLAWRFVDTLFSRDFGVAFFEQYAFAEYFVPLVFASLVHEVFVLEGLMARMADDAQKFAPAPGD